MNKQTKKDEGIKATRLYIILQLVDDINIYQCS